MLSIVRRTLVRLCFDIWGTSGLFFEVDITSAFRLWQDVYICSLSYLRCYDCGRKVSECYNIRSPYIYWKWGQLWWWNLLQHVTITGYLIYLICLIQISYPFINMIYISWILSVHTHLDCDVYINGFKDYIVGMYCKDRNNIGYKDFVHLIDLVFTFFLWTWAYECVWNKLQWSMASNEHVCIRFITVCTWIHKYINKIICTVCYTIWNLLLTLVNI